MKNEPLQILNTSNLFHSPITTGQYLLYNFFRILRPMRLRYHLTINDLILLTGVYVFHKVKYSAYSANQMRTFVGYFNNNKFVFHHSRLIDRGFIIASDGIKNRQYYRISEEGIRVINDIDQSYDNCLYSFIDSNSISL